jgi:DNA polymerase-3 subunit alpha
MLNLNKDKAGKINKIILDARQFGVEILPPNINNSEMNFSITNNKILFGLSAITGIGGTLAEEIINERNINGKFNDFNDFINRVNPTKAQIINLVKSGAIPTKNKKQFLIKYLKSQYEQKEYKPVSSLPSKMALLTTWDIDTSEYMIGKKVDKERVLALYNDKRKVQFDEEQKLKYQKYIDECNEKYLKDELFWEFETLQIFVSDENPFEEAYKILNDFSSYDVGEKCVIVGIISKIQKKKTKKGQQFAFANIYSGDGIIEIVLWPDALQKFQDLVVKGQQVAVLGKKDGDDKMIADKLKSYSQWLTDVTKKMNRNKF